MRRLLQGAALALGLATAGSASAAETVRLAGVAELSGSGAVVGEPWKNGVELAIAEINQRGGILGRRIELALHDTRSDPGLGRAVLVKALEGDPYVVLGPVYSSSVLAGMIVTQRAEVPQIVGAEASEVTEAGNPFVFRTSFAQTTAMPKLAAWLVGQRARSLAIVYANDAFGKGGRDAMVTEMQRRGLTLAADIATEVQQASFGAEVTRLKQAGADALLVYLHEDQSARILQELRRQGYDRPIVGETTLLSQRVLALAGAAANGIKGHVGLSAEAPVPAVQAMAERYARAYGAKPDHNAIKGYIAVHLVKGATELNGRFDRKELAARLKNLTLTTKEEPGVLMDVRIDLRGDIDRQSFLVEVRDGRQVIVEVLPPVRGP